MTQSFAFYSLTNPRMHAAKYKSDEYDRYLQRI